MAIGWRPIDLDAGFLPFGHGLGMQIALSDPAFMALQGLAPFPDTDVAGFPYDADETEQRIAAGDERAGTRAQMAAAWGRDGEARPVGVGIVVAVGCVGLGARVPGHWRGGCGLVRDGHPGS